MGCPGGINTIRYTRLVFTRVLQANFSLSSPRKKIVMGKKDRCPMFGCINDRLFSRDTYSEVLFSPEKPS